MKVILFGATGMVGQSALRECLLDSDVESVLSIGRRPSGVSNAKLREIVHRDFTDFSALEKDVAGFDACFFCLGVSSAGMSEKNYRHVTQDVTLAAARTLLKASPKMTFIYVTGSGTDSTERGRSMWARVKGETENALLAMGFGGAYMFRPGYIQPLHGVTPSAKMTRAMYAAIGPLYPVWKTLFPKYVTTSERVGRAMLHVAKNGFSKRVLENADIDELGRG